ncbi:response regulator transcription factor [Ramlibacter sp. AN1133]|uniref:response regulator transcription factor n=1 Tax=Ramlibacter sp. AN1133 TaxID=3133429 RepID=UPI0030BAECCC
MVDAIHVVLADDHELVRSGIRALLHAIDGVQVIAEVSDGVGLLDLLESVHPDVVITDLSMPGMDGITVLRRIHERYPQLRVIVLSMNQSAELVKQAIASGANAYVRKDAPEIELEIALRGVITTGSYYNSRVTQLLLEPTEPAMEEQLTQRQIEILAQLASGKSSKEIAFALGLSPKTVDVHRARIMDRLGLRDVASLTLYAVRKGLVRP